MCLQAVPIQFSLAHSSGQGLTHSARRTNTITEADTYTWQQQRLGGEAAQVARHTDTAVLRSMHLQGTCCGEVDGSNAVNKAPGATGGWLACSDYVNGGPCFLVDSSTEEAAHCEVLARYAETGVPSAIRVRCPGGGTAVLCATHPELPATALDDAAHGPMPESVAGPMPTQRAYRQRVMQLQGQLVGADGTNERLRQCFFLQLLCFAGLCLGRENADAPSG